MPRSECRGRVAVTYSLEVCCNQTGDRYAARRYERARFYREVTATRLAGLFTQSRESGSLMLRPTEPRRVRRISTYHLVRGGFLMFFPTRSRRLHSRFLHTHLVRDCVKRRANRVAVTSR